MTIESPTRRKRLTREEAKAQTRELLLEAARRMFAERGYEAAKLDEIAADAGFTKGAMYFHFPSKDALFVELLDSELRRHNAELDAMVEVAANSPDTLNAELRQWLDRNDEGPDLALLGLEVQLASRRNASVAVQVEEALANYVRALTEFLKSYFRVTGHRPAVPIELLPATLVALLEGLALTRQVYGRDSVAKPAQIIRLLVGDNE